MLKVFTLSWRVQVLGFRVQGSRFRVSTVQTPTAVDQSFRLRVKREQLRMFCLHSPESRGQNLALTVVYVPYSLDSGC